MTADIFLSRLDRVKKSGPGRWLALCPAHKDKSPSLAIREIDDGRVLVKCFTGCDVESILASVGLGWDAVMPPRVLGEFRRERQPFNAHDVMMALETELTIASVTLLDIGHGKHISDTDRQRALLASRRIRTAIDLACPR